ncbi:cell cycle checkpoint [Sistotremastrum suecicum HHB10207 ss-3]|uniref:Checkpoint protein n=1 Tax=Sistotremastrum suecicum HHB10207 ss-3 TaxID=1314776 RepID=A0A166EVX4_9AGAM|nr:cell cycle checkpoint [Sistotremastrum suecicum HHB10207 ss-3]
MRFRASIENVPTFSKIMQSIEKLSKTCTIRLTEETIRIICNTANEGGVQVWSSPTIFSEYRIESNANNEITLVLATEALLHVLKSAISSPEVMVKLAKRNNVACLSFDIVTQTKQGKKVQIAHDVKIVIMKPTEAELLKEPLCPEPDVHIVLPPLQKLRTVVERLRSLSDVIGIFANGSGQLKLAIQTERIKSDTLWTGLTNPVMREPEPAEEHDHDPEEFHAVLISARSLLKFLTAHVIANTTIACICARHCIILYVYIGSVGEPGGVLTFYLPAILDEDED